MPVLQRKMRLVNIISFLSFAFALSSNIQVSDSTCTVIPLGGEKDDGPNILAAFQTCGLRSKIVLDGAYTVGTVLVTTELENVHVEFKGSRKYTIHG